MTQADATTTATAPSPSRSAPRSLPSGAWFDRNRNALIVVGLLWLEYAVVWTIAGWGQFPQLDFRDPDDAMRLVQVRDFLAGQNWFDVSQHRINPPLGGPMHWSRLVDLPIAGLIVLLRPLLGTAMAETVACIAVPLLTTALLCLALFKAIAGVFGNIRALVTVALLVTSFPILLQLIPLRIDHHGWQIAMAAVALAGILHPDPRRGGWIAGFGTALWLHISGEALPYTVVVGVALALRLALRDTEWARVVRYLAGLAAGSVTLLLVTKGWQASLVDHCDSVSPVYLGPLVLMPLLAGAVRRLTGRATLVRRVAPLAIAGIVAAGLFLATAGPCLKGPFESLDPVVYNFWYLGVMEGQPVWRQDLYMALIILVPPIVGIAGTIAALWFEEDGDLRFAWMTLLALAVGSFAISILVLRAMSVAHLFALAGNGWIIARIYPRIAVLRSPVSRVVLTVALGLLSPAGLATAAGQFGEKVQSKPVKPYKSPGCTASDQLARLAALPPMTLFAPLDFGPKVLLKTHHRVIGTAHHRNIAGMTKVLKGFLAGPDDARAIVRSTRADHVVICTELGEMGRYRAANARDLAAQLMDGRHPDWLTPVDVPGMTAIRLYRVDRARL